MFVMPSDKNMHSLYAIYSKYSNIVCNSCISKLCSLFSNKRFMLNEIFLQTLDNTSQSALLQTASTNWPKVWHGFQNLFEIWKLLKFFYDLLRLFPIHTVLPHIFEKKVIMLLSIWFVNVPTIWEILKHFAETFHWVQNSYLEFASMLGECIFLWHTIVFVMSYIFEYYENRK